MTAPVIQVVGFSNTGKTLLIEGLIRAIKRRGLQVAAIKHAPHGYEVDVPGKDTWRYHQAGADQVVVAGPQTLTFHRRYQEEPTLRQICAMLKGVDLILVEGFKGQQGPKIEVLREGYSPARLELGSDLVAVVGEQPPAGRIACFSREAIEPLTDFILKRLGLDHRV